MKYPALIRVKDKSVKTIKEIPFYVGYSSSCDMRINNNALNDIHFCIITDKDEYVMEDQSTYFYNSVDDEFTSIAEKKTLKDKSIIRAANELFIFVKGDDNFVPEIKSSEERVALSRFGLRSRKIRKPSSVVETFKFIIANEAFISYMNDECVDDVVFFAYELPNQNCDYKRIAVCICTEGQKGNVKHLRDVCGKTDKMSNVEILSLKMADDCEIEVFDNLGNEVDSEFFCWTGLAFFKEVETSKSATGFSINLKRFGKTVGSIKIEL